MLLLSGLAASSVIPRFDPIRRTGGIRIEGNQPSALDPAVKPRDDSLTYPRDDSLTYPRDDSLTYPRDVNITNRGMTALGAAG